MHSLLRFQGLRPHLPSGNLDMYRVSKQTLGLSRSDHLPFLCDILLTDPVVDMPRIFI